jgi:hypothetical protein
MFLFNSLQKGSLIASGSTASRSVASSSPNSLQNRLLGVLALAAVFCLSAALLFSGCQPEDDSFVDDHRLNSQLIGTWTNSQFGDSYTITSTYLSYGYGNDFISYAGAVRYVSNFSEDAGVIIIEYDDDHKATYPEYDDEWNVIGTLPLKGNFIGIYYKELKSGVSVKMGGAYADGGAEEATLDAAKKAFTLGNEGNYMSMYGTYLK